ncbi:ATP-binding protein [Actimicrobium sp. CCC2.4]|uniref:HAMP domain-containing sensor histidine kinase n=1 Tax=Actimicrobium sp. CCC2.4 TaxID=3048606 RepID=UPI002AC90F82|nr:ATP-binding protein [Actimicrobium sp. CCC2.4]MEB0137192.1 ATP-binding protein [Actimicrobium sp. CCC2.4]WPX32489.1 ATP-binding protein [Actimicrobium sp. CCC2.4]
MKLKKLSFWFSLVVMLALAANAVFLVMIKQSYDSVVTAQAHRQDAISLAEKLKEDTEQLTSLVRTYTSTGEARYLTYYYDILAIREGDKPQPASYDSGAYWDSVIAGTTVHKMPVQGLRISFSGRMKSLGFSPDEFKALNVVYAATDAMKQMEQTAFAATQGLFDPATQQFVSDGEAHLSYANQLVYSTPYNVLKADLARSVLTLGALTNARTNESVSLATHDLERWILLMSCSVGFTFLMILAASEVIRRQVLRPIAVLSTAARRLANGDYSARITADGMPGGHRAQGVRELVSLGATFDGMAASIERDIQLRQEAQHALEAANQKAEDATRAKSMFLANMSHEIRTPMNAVIGMTYLALRSDLTARQHDYVSKAHLAAKSLLRLLNDILDFSKVEAGKLELEHVPFLLEDVIGNVLGLLSQPALDKGLVLSSVITEPQLLGRQGALRGDPLRLSQVLTNLLSNAVKFTDHGSVTLDARIDERGDDDVLLHFIVTDTGIGLSAEQLTYLFLEFTQADGSTTRKYGGTGLGLSISKKFIELMGGQVWAESRDGQGARFHCTARFPLASGDEVLRPPDADDRPGNDLSGMRVLLAEDNPINQQLAIELIESRGACVTLATNGQEALDLLATVAADHFDVVLMDLQMPVMDGYAASSQVRADPRYAALPLIAMTAHAMLEERERCTAAGMNGHLSKPVEPAMLCAMLARHYPIPRLASPTDAVPVVRAADGRTTLPRIAGLDTMEGVRFSADSASMYRQLLSMFADSYTDCNARLVQLLADAQWQQVEMLAHTIKGLAGTLGMADLRQPASALELACAARDVDEAARAQARLAQVITPLLAGLHTFFAVQAADSVRAALPMPAADTLRQLCKLLDEGDSDAIDLWQQQGRELAGMLSPARRQRIDTALQNFEFDTALALLAETNPEQDAA